MGIEAGPGFAELNGQGAGLRGLENPHQEGKEIKGGTGRRTEEQIRLKAAPKSSQMARGDHPLRVGAGHQKGTSAAPARTQQSWEKHGDKFSAVPHQCLRFSAALAGQSMLLVYCRYG